MLVCAGIHSSNIDSYLVAFLLTPQQDNPSKDIPQSEETNTNVEDDSDTEEEDENPEEEEARKKALKGCKPCEHEGEGIHSFIEYDGFYYTPTWVSTKVNFPTHCGGCAREILAGSAKYLKEQGVVVDPAKHYRVTGDWSVFFCRNAHNKYHECKFALCKPCRLEACKKRKADNESAIESNRRGRRCRKTVDLCLPGEAIDPDTGCMVASV